MVQMLRVGAGGRWRVYNEKFDPNVVKQQSKVSCGPACGEMLFRDQGVRMTQKIIEEASYAPIDAKELAKVLKTLDPSNSRGWEGGGVYIPGANDEDIVKVLNSTGSWAAQMWQWGASIGHLVVIDGFDHHGRLNIRDPWEGTSYKMELKDFFQVWQRIAVYSLP